MNKYVQVVVNVGGIEGFFDYHVPEEFENELQIGSLVLVPFGKQVVQGIIRAFIDIPQVPKTKAIENVLDSKPVITPAQQKLAEWMAKETLSGLGECYQLMLPPGISRKADRLYKLGILPENFPLSPLQQRIVTRLQERGPQRGRQLDTAFRRLHWKESIRNLIRQGLITSEPFLPPVRVRKKMVNTVHIACEPGEIEVLLSKIGRPGSAANRRKAVMDFLLNEPEGVEAQVINAITSANSTDIKQLVKGGLVYLDEIESFRDPLKKYEWIKHEAPVLSKEQLAAWKQIKQRIDTNQFEKPIVIHGITSSGKTELYLKSVKEMLRNGRQAIVLVPEISLTPQTVQRFHARFPGKVGIIHSKLSDGERFDTWRKARDGELTVIVGPRSALFAPLPDLGIIVIDEAHDDSYFQSDIAPRYSTLRAALAYGRITKSIVIYGSATPGVELMYRAQQQQWPIISLPFRVMAHREEVANTPGADLEVEGDVTYLPLPKVQIVDMRSELKSGNRSIFSRALQSSMQDTLENGHQVILFLNRRGSATYVFCRNCGYKVTCPRCGIPMVFHANKKIMICHHCNYQRNLPTKCPDCGSPQIKQFGTGTERVELEAKKIFPGAKILRLDSSVTRLKGAHEEVLKQFSDRKADILVGTQMLAKGIDLPYVTLVGVILADVGLGLPDFRSPERTFQLLMQVAGRAGRSPLGGKVVFQTYSPDNYAVQKAARHDFSGFYEQELSLRAKLGYPPFSRLIRLEFQSQTNTEAQEDAEKASSHIKHLIQSGDFNQTSVIGPVPCFYQRIGGMYRWQVIIRGPKPIDLIRGKDFGKAIVTVDPISLL